MSHRELLVYPWASQMATEVLRFVADCLRRELYTGMYMNRSERMAATLTELEVELSIRLGNVVRC